MKISELLEEEQRGHWRIVLAQVDKEELGDDLIRLVGNAYSGTTYGSRINNIGDILPSNWYVYSWDRDPEIDACVFFRSARGTESWIGHKIQGLGHDGRRHSKDAAIRKIENLCGRWGWWIETSDAMRHLLRRSQLRAVTDERLLQQLFPHSELQMIDSDTYVRKLEDGSSITETVFGNPVLRGDH